jgi:Condensation domain
MSNERIFPVSFAQQRLLFLDQLDPGASAYNLTRAIRMVGPLDPDALTKTLNKIVQRHGSIRTKFVREAEKGYQIVSDDVELQLPIIDIYISSSPRRSRTRSTAIGEGRGTQKLQPDLRPPLSRYSRSPGLSCSCTCARNAPHHHRWVVDEHPIRRNWANIR